MKRMIGLILALALALGLCACGSKAETAPAEEVPVEEVPTWQEQYDLGLRFLSEGNYKEAIIAFEAAIKIDPKLPEAYVGLADVYTAQGDTDKAMEILRQALEALGENESLSAALEALQPAGPQPLEGYPKTERSDFGDEYTIFEYDEFGRLTRSTSYTTADDAVIDYWEYTYEGIVSETNQYGWREVKEEAFKSNGTLRTRREYLYTPGSTAVVSRESFFSDTRTTVREFPYTMQSPVHYIVNTGYRSDGHEEYALIWERDLDTKQILKESWVGTDGTVFPPDAF